MVLVRMWIKKCRHDVKKNGEIKMLASKMINQKEWEEEQERRVTRGLDVSAINAGMVMCE